MIELKGVTKQYLYGARVLGALDLTVDEGEILAVLGGEGSGKTTFLKVVAGVTDCEGQVLFDGEQLGKKPDGVVMIFDDLAVFKKRSCFYNLSYPLKIRGKSEDEIRRAVGDAAARMGIFACLGERADKMTLSERKRLAIARMLLRKARAVFVDDVTRGLDSEEAETLWSEFAPILLEKAKEGASVVFTTSRLSEAISVADRIAVMHAGELKQLGSYDEIVSSPSSVWAAQAVDKGFAFERVRLEVSDGNIVALFDGKYAVDVSRLKDNIIGGYLEKEALAGWHSDAYDVDGGRRERVLYALREGGGYLLHTEDRVVFSKKKRDEVGTLPLADKVFLFDVTNENSILRA